MPDHSQLDGLIDRADHVFQLASKLGLAFLKERQEGGRVRQVDPKSWGRHQPDFDAFCAAVLDLRDAIQNPPNGFAPVAKALRNAAALAMTIRDKMKMADGQRWAEFLDFYPRLISAGADGCEAIREVLEAQPPDDPFAFINQPTVDTSSSPQCPGDGSDPAALGVLEKPNEGEPVAPKKPRTKRSTERGEGRAKLIAALTKHHQYADDSCLNQEPVGNNALAKAAGVSVSTASAFFDDKFQGHTTYKAICRDSGNLVAALKLLNDEFAPYHLLGEASSDLAASEEADDE